MKKSRYAKLLKRNRKLSQKLKLSRNKFSRKLRQLSSQLSKCRKLRQLSRKLSQTRKKK